MTAPLPDAVGVVERLTKRADIETRCGNRTEHESNPACLMSEAATLIQSQAARIAELEAERVGLRRQRDELHATTTRYLEERRYWQARHESLVNAIDENITRQARSLLSEGEGK